MRSGAFTRLRLAAAATTVALLATGCWTTYGYDAANTRSVDSSITAANAPRLHELWRISGTDGSTSTPAVFGGVVYFGNWDGTLRAVSAATGAPIWTRQLSTAVIDDSPLVVGDTVYIGDGTGNLHAVNRETGVPRWSVDLDPHPQT